MTRAVYVILLVSVAARVVHADGPPPTETKLPTHGLSAGACATFTPDGTAVIYFDGSGIATWDIEQRKTIATIPTTEWAFVLSPDGTRIANELKGSIRLYDAKSGKMLHELRPPPTNARPAPGMHGPFFRALGFGEGSKQFFTANPDDLQVWDVATGKMLRRIGHKGRPINNPGHQSYDGRWLGVDYGTAGAEILDTRASSFTSISARSLLSIIPRDGKRFMVLGLSSWSFAGDGQTFYAVDENYHVLAGWSLPDGKLRSHVTIPHLVFASVSRDGSRILARYEEPEDKILRILDSKTLEPIVTVGPLNSTVAWYAISPDNRYVVTTSVGDPRIWDFSPGKDAEHPSTGPGSGTPRK